MHECRRQKERQYKDTIIKNIIDYRLNGMFFIIYSNGPVLKKHSSKGVSEFRKGMVNQTAYPFRSHSLVILL